MFVPPKLLLCQLSTEVHHSIVGAPSPHHTHFHVQITYLCIYISCMYLYIHIYSYMYISKKYIHRVYMPGCIFSRNSTKTRRAVCLRVGSSAGKTLQLDGSITENLHDTESNGLSQKESTGLSQPSFCRGHVSIFGGRGGENLCGQFKTTNPSLCPKNVVISMIGENGQQKKSM